MNWKFTNLCEGATCKGAVDFLLRKHLLKKHQNYTGSQLSFNFGERRLFFKFYVWEATLVALFLKLKRCVPHQGKCGCDYISVFLLDSHPPVRFLSNQTTWGNDQVGSSWIYINANWHKHLTNNTDREIYQMMF